MISSEFHHFSECQQKYRQYACSLHSTNVFVRWNLNFKILIFPNGFLFTSISCREWNQLTVIRIEAFAGATFRIVYSFCNLVQGNSVGIIWKYHFIFLSSFCTHSIFRKKEEEISSVLGCKNSVQIRICAWINRIEEHQKDLRSSHVNQWISGQSCQTKKCYWSPAGEICENLRKNNVLTH